MSLNDRNEFLIRLTAEVAAAYIAGNMVPQAMLPSLITDIHASLSKLSRGDAPLLETPQKPAVPIRKSVTEDYIICLEDGKKFKSLKQHLGVYYKLTPEEYRAKWGLPADYPMVAPAYAAARSVLARKMGLGRKAGVKAKRAKWIKSAA